MLTNDGEVSNPNGDFRGIFLNGGGFGAVGGSSSSERGGFGAVGGSSSNGARGFGGVGGSSSNGNNNDGRDPNPLGGFGAFRSRSPNDGGLGGVGGSYSNGGVGGVDYRESDTSASKSNDGSEVNLSQRDDEFLNGVKNLKHLQSHSKNINQPRESHQQEAPSSSTASSSSSMPSSPTASSSSSMPSLLTPSESPASTSGLPGLGGVINNQTNNAMGG